MPVDDTYSTFEKNARIVLPDGKDWLYSPPTKTNMV